MAKGGLIPVMAVVGTLVAFLYIFTTMPIPMIDPAIGAHFAAVFPGLLISFFGVITSVEVKNGPGIIGCFTVTGVGLAILLSELNTDGMVTDAMLLPATLLQVQFLVILAAMIMGVLMYKPK